MGKGYIITWLLRGMPEAFIYMYVVHMMTHTRRDKKKFWFSVWMISILMVLVRSLPLSYGIHTIVLAVCILFFSIIICNVELIAGTSSVLGSLMVEFMCEGCNVVLLRYFFKANMERVMSSPLIKNIYGVPSLLLMFLILSLIGKVKGRREA